MEHSVARLQGLLLVKHMLNQFTTKEAPQSKCIAALCRHRLTLISSYSCWAPSILSGCFSDSNLSLGTELPKRGLASREQ